MTTQNHEGFPAQPGAGPDDEWDGPDEVDETQDETQEVDFEDYEEDGEDDHSPDPTPDEHDSMYDEVTGEKGTSSKR